MEPIRSIYENDSDMVDLVRGFSAELPNRADLLEELLSQGHWTELRRLAHQLKGAGGGYGFPKITEVAASLEQALKQSAPESEVKERTGALCEVLRAVQGPEGS
jgi:HPt (histidine-containing phosphotransfer) domain-containing protein